jgi:3-phosphoshikimate 1-carboxyvinyltransferase
MKLEAPGSKSMTQRALLIAALTPAARVRVERPLLCDDSRYLTDLLRAMGTRVEWSEAAIDVRPAPLSAPAAAVFLGNAGTAVRFGACLSLLVDGALAIDGDRHMRRRPLGALGRALGELGVAVRYDGQAGCVPIRLERIAEPPREVAVDMSLSSQYASGLLMVAPRLARGLTLELTGELVSMPYLRMTAAMMARAGARLAWEGERRVTVSPGGYRAPDALEVEPDWSAAAFLIAAARLAARDVEIAGLSPPDRSLQGDAAFAAMLAAVDAGAAELDLTDVPDLIAPLTVACLFADHPVRIRGAAHTRVKECDRVAVLCRELGRVGAVMAAHPDGLDVAPLTAPANPPAGTSVELDPEDDHRMAMAFGILSLRVPGIVVRNPGCVSKSFPRFWETLAQIGGVRP